MAGLVNLYRSATLAPKQATALGQTGSIYDLNNSIRRRKRTLIESIENGRLDPHDLGQADRTLVTGGVDINLRNGARVDSNPTHPSFFGLLGNLGSDLYDLGKGIGPGIAAVAAASFHDVTQPLALGKNRDSQLFEKVIKPTAQATAQDFSNIYHGRWNELYQHPLNPILDIATVGSLGAGAAARGGKLLASTAAEGSVAQRAGTAASKLIDQTRNPIEIGTTRVDRSYSRSPFVNASQRLFDQAAPRRVQEYLARTSTMRRDYVNAAAEAAMNSLRASSPLNRALKELTPEEGEALFYMWDGIRTPNEINAYADHLERTIRGQNPEGQNAVDLFENPDDPDAITWMNETARRISALRGPVGQRILNMTPAMQKVDQIWQKGVEGRRVEANLPDEVHNEHLQRQREMMDEMLEASGLERGDLPESTVEPTYVPHRSLRSREWHDPNAIQAAFGMEPGLRPKKFQPETKEITPANMFAPSAQNYLMRSSGESFRFGNYRTDVKVLSDHVRNFERDLVDNVYRVDTKNKWAYKGYDKNGEYKPIQGTAKEVRERMRKDHPGEDYTLIPAGNFESMWIKKEGNLAKDIMARGDQLVREGYLEESPEFMQAMAEFLESDAADFMNHSVVRQVNAPVMAIPTKVFNYQKDLLQASNPITRFGLKQIAQFMNLWRRATLTWMPRWALNTAVGSWIQAMVAGAINPRDYILAYRMARKGDLPAGVELGRTSTAEMLQEPTRWIERNIGIRTGLTQWIADRVQATEDFFRKGVFVNRLRKAGRLDEAERLEEMGNVLTRHLRSAWTDSEHLKELMSNPHLVREALDDTNKFMYNYMALGPIERRYVRQFIPFWGWYKFITKLTWRLPVEYPGRSLVMMNLAAVGNEQLEELGPMPPWLQGSIMLNFSGGVLTYLSGQGLNPFSGFANPAAIFADTGVSGTNAILQLGQFNPLIQGALQAAGTDTLTGGRVRVSPQSGVGTDPFGNLVDTQTGEQKSAAQVNPIERFVMTIIRSFPQARSIERYAMGGVTPYPESVPIPGMVKPMYAPVERSSNPERDFVLSFFGVDPRQYDLKSYQERRKKFQKYAENQAESSMKRLSKRLRTSQP